MVLRFLWLGRIPVATNSNSSASESLTNLLSLYKALQQSDGLKSEPVHSLAPTQRGASGSARLWLPGNSTLDVFIPIGEVRPQLNSRQRSRNILRRGSPEGPTWQKCVITRFKDYKCDPRFPAWGLPREGRKKVKYQKRVSVTSSSCCELLGPPVKPT